MAFFPTKISTQEIKYFRRFNSITCLFCVPIVVYINFVSNASKEVCLAVAALWLPYLVIGYSWAKRSAKLEELEDSAVDGTRNRSSEEGALK